MPLIVSSYRSGGNLPGNLLGPINNFLKSFDNEIKKIAKDEGFYPSEIRILRPCSFSVFVSDDTVFAVITNIDSGGMPSHKYIDWSGKSLNLQDAIFLAERDLAYKEAFGFTFPKKILTETNEEKEAAARELAKQYIDDEITYLERLEGIVRINPIFNGREFMLNKNLVFVLSPFKEPFNTIFQDHIKPTVESLEAVTCLRADDIYDNKPIIDDIWRGINEAHIVISELTDRNPNVFYETGIAHTIGKEVILITQKIEDVPFDLRHLRCIVYEYTPRGVQTLQVNLKNTISSIRNRMP